MGALQISHRSGRARRLSWLVVAGLTTVALIAPASASATPKDGNGEVTICHRTNSVTNPYEIITVDYSSVDGSLVHDNGNGDHPNHLGLVFDVTVDPDVAYPTPRNGDQWGDIIPAFSWPGDDNHPGGSYPGLNWGEAGQIIHRNGCNPPETTTTTSTTTDTTTTDTTTTDTTTTDTTTEETTTEETTTEQTTVSDTTTTDTTTTDTTTEETTTEETTSTQTTTTDSTTTDTTSTETTTTDITSTQTTSTEPTPTPTPNPTPTPTPNPTPTPTPTPTATPSPTPTPTEEPTQPLTGEVLSEIGAPAVTLPPTDTLSQSTPAPSGDNWRLILLAMAGILAGSLVMTPSKARARREDR